MKHLKTAVLAASLLLAAAAQAGGNPYRQSYGTWEETVGKNGKASAERFVIGRHGFEEFAAPRPECANRKQGYSHQTDRIGGSKLAADIRASIKDDGIGSPQEAAEAYAASLRDVLAEIRPDKKYPRVSLSLSCSDGAMVFIQLNRNEGLRMYSAPDAYYLPVRRVK